ncbi:MAG TPA: protein kinase [Blastocatellia bacterium]|nr:protein kinase [Blastocatellia bacterium]
MVGRLILHYRVLEHLGAGGMGEVYLAEDTRLGRQVALKFLPASYQYDLERRERFLREARAVSALSSPNIAAIYDIGDLGGSSFLVMEYVEGELLSQRVSKGPLPIEEAINITMQAADALQEAHSQGIVHRDIKSANLIVTERGLVKVLDFGLAKVIELERPPGANSGSEDSGPTVRLGQETVPGLVMGTVSYMSPEQALGQNVDHRSDIFSLGVVCYEMLTARLPFEGESQTAIIDKILHAEPPALARLNYSVPPELERIVRKALEKDPNFRYQTAREMYIDLHNLSRDLNVARATTSLSHLFGNQRPTVALDVEQTGGTKLENAVAVITFANITREPADDWIGAGIAETVTADLKNIRGISVIGRERVFETLKNFGSGNLGEVDETFAISIGRRLGARWIITGGYQRLADMLRITARIIEVETGEVLRTVKIDGRIAEIFALQDRIVYELSRGLNLELGTSELDEIRREETRSVEAYEYFSRGMVNLRSGSRDSLDRGIYLFQKATEIDPNYAKAWAALGAAYDLKGSFLSIPELSEKAIEFAQTAIKLNPRLSHAHQFLGNAYISLGRYDEAIASLKKALEIEPNSANSHAALARAYWIGKGMIEEAIAEHEQAVAINPQGGYAYLQLAFLHALRGNYERAEAVCKKAVDLQEKFISGKEGLQVVGAHSRLGYVYYLQSRFDEALREYNREMEFLSMSDHALRERTLIELNQKMGAAYFRKGMMEEAERHFRTAIKKYEERLRRGVDDPFTKYYIACVYALQGDTDRAIKYFGETLTHLRALNTLRARIDPDLETIRDDPRFRQLIGE